ncbi:hypothetical protein HZC32_01565 [Candidatus Woesearchaeota archaeon]|nr:hypothetical protein [Candidatus Woesearchaeota archaeon]
MVVFTNVKKEALLKLTGLTKDKPKTIYEELRLKKGKVTLVLYTSGKLLLQGEKREIEELSRKLRGLKIGKREQPEQFRRETGWIIGSDEALKGDTFGGITVAAVKADDKIRKQLLELGVADSKKLSDHEIVRIADSLRKIVPCEIKNIFPEEYNQHQGKVTLLLNRLHQECGQYLKPGRHIVDKYPGCNAGDAQEERAESKYLEVAAASILARDAALKQLNSLSVLAGFGIPKGSTHVKLALEELKQRKLKPNVFVKVDFDNVKEYLTEE